MASDVNGAVDVIVEIPAGTRNKYEIDHATGALRLERRLPASLVYPADYGYIPGTLAEDGDPLDALVVLGDPVVPGCIVRVVPLGVLWVTDDKGRDPKVLSVLAGDAERDGLADVGDVPERILQEIEQFFDVYKDLEDDKSTATCGWADRAAAEAEIAACRARHADDGC
jgi:inorganic pyrophosphatase